MRSSLRTFQECPVFKRYIKDEPCSPQKGVMTEPTAHTDLVPLSALPGCNPLWGATGAKPTCSTPPAQPDPTKFKGTDGSLVTTSKQNLVLPTIAGWKDIGCIQSGAQMLLNGTKYTDASISQTTCLDSCLRSGYPYATIGKVWGQTWVSQRSRLHADPVGMSMRGRHQSQSESIPRHV